ncbi:MAG: 3-isopropylmalate dehydrogenase [Blautia sp.]|nr:3-isopropylmalate dehydrogenase [Blautia sp.]
MKEMPAEKEALQWHPAFFAGIQIELKDDKENLSFENEHQLSTKPMEIDVLVIKKEKDVPVRKNIGRIFRKHNIIEYKSPKDYLSIDDFYKVYGYACFYKADTGAADEIRSDELTITLVSSRYPFKLIQHLKEKRGYAIENSEDGIYYVKGDHFPIQIIVTSKLSETENLWLKNLTDDMKEAESAKKLIDDYGKNRENNLYQSVMDIIMKANKKKFVEVRGMCNALQELMKDELEEAEKAGIEKGIEKGIQVVIENCKEFHLSYEQTVHKIAEKYELPTEKAEEYMKRFW